jgi:hypothetical protein
MNELHQHLLRIAQELDAAGPSHESLIETLKAQGSDGLADLDKDHLCQLAKDPNKLVHSILDAFKAGSPSFRADEMGKAFTYLFRTKVLEPHQLGVANQQLVHQIVSKHEADEMDGEQDVAHDLLMDFGVDPMDLDISGKWRAHRIVTQDDHAKQKQFKKALENRDAVAYGHSAEDLAAIHEEGYRVNRMDKQSSVLEKMASELVALDGMLRSAEIDHERFPKREGLEGPYELRNRMVVYYDEKKGQYYNSLTDMFLSDDELEAADGPKNFGPHRVK